MNGTNKVTNQKDHIILPKATLKRFMDPETNKIKYLDLSNPDDISIKEAFPRAFHTKTNFYYPECDKQVKKIETMLGKYHYMFSAHNKSRKKFNITERQLKADIINIITIQFNRTILADDELLSELLEKFKADYREESLLYLRNGIYPAEFQDRNQKFNQASKDLDSFRYYAQSILGQKNQNIIKMYENFIPQILIIPDEISSTFILSPQHFTGSNTFVRIVLSPRIALSLYPQSLTNDKKLIKYLTKEEVDILAPRTIESALSMNNEFRQIVGEGNYLNCIKNTLEKYKSMICDFKKDIVLIKGDTVVLNGDQDFLDLAISIMFFKPEYHKIIIEVRTISSEFLQKSEFLQCVQMFEMWELHTVFINKNDLDIINTKIKVAPNIDEAITMF